MFWPEITGDDADLVIDRSASPVTFTELPGVLQATVAGAVSSSPA